MKKIIIITTVLIAAFAAPALAKDKIDAAVLNSFQKEFPGATHIEWSNERDYARAIFVYNNSRVAAYFHYDGEFLGTTRNILYNQLPLAVIKGINESRFATADVIETLEVTKNHVTEYYLTMVRKKKTYSVCASASGEISVIGKQSR